MVRHFITFNETARIYPQTERNTDNDEHSSGQLWNKISKRKVDWNNKQGEFNLNDLNIHEITTEGELKAALEDVGMPEDSGIYYLYIRNRMEQPKANPKKFKRKGKIKTRNGRPPYSRPALQDLGIKNRPRQKSFEGLNCILKFEAANGKIINIFKQKGKRKRKPYNKPTYELLRKLELNKKNKNETEF